MRTFLLNYFIYFNLNVCPDVHFPSISEAIGNKTPHILWNTSGGWDKRIVNRELHTNGIFSASLNVIKFKKQYSSQGNL